MLTETPLETQLRVNAFCRTQQPPIACLTADVYGAFAALFVDVGDGFEVVDATGEDLREVYIAAVSQVSVLF